MARELLAPEDVDVRPLLDHVRSRTGCSGREARRALSATVTTLASCLDAPARAALAHELGELAPDIARSEETPAMDAVALYAEVGRRSRLAPAHALEATGAVLETLSEALPGDLVVRMRKLLHPSLADKLVPRLVEGEPPVHVRHHPPFEMHRGPTLSTGRPGFVEPLADARRSGAQSGSVTMGPAHQDTKLSSAHGTTQEQDDRTLAEATRTR